MAMISTARSTDNPFARWLSRTAAFIVGMGLGLALASVLVRVVLPGVLPGLEPAPLSSGGPARVTGLLALLCGVACAVFVSAYQSSRSGR